MKLIRNNISSPFKLARSVVNSRGGAYEEGGYNPDAFDRSNEIYTASLESMSKIVGAAFSGVTETDKYDMAKSSNERREKRVSKIDSKLSDESVDEKVKSSLEKRKENINKRSSKASEFINNYETIYGKDGTSNDYLKKKRKKWGSS